MNIKELILGNYVMLFELLGLLITLFISAHISRKIKVLTRITIGLLFVAIVNYYLEAWTQTFETFSYWRMAFTSIKYLLFSLIMFLIITLVGEAIHPLSKKAIIILIVPLMVSIPLFFTSQWTHLVCYFSEENHWHGGPLRLYPYFLFGYYLVFFIVENVINLKKYSTQSRFIVVYICGMAFAGALLYMIFDFGDNFLAIFTSSLVFYFIFLYIHMAGIDPLTRLLNRQLYYQDMNLKADSISAVVSIDMNELKYYNDVFGHDAGDEALVTVANVIRDNAGNSSSVYRIGGDEFIVFYYNVKEEFVIKQIDKIKDGLKQTKYTCAIGYEMNDSKKNIEEALKKADNKMYADKARIKKKLNSKKEH